LTTLYDVCEERLEDSTVPGASALSEGELARVLARYNLGELKAARRVERGFVNENWIVETARGRYFLKRRAPHLRQPDVIGAQHALIARLRQSGFPAPAVLRNGSGETLTVLGGEFYEIHGYIEGQPYDHGRTAHLEEAAVTLGRYHVHAQGFADRAMRARGKLYSPTILRTNLTDLAEAWRLDRDPESVQVVRRLEAHADELAAGFAQHGALPHLVIHGDYYAGNLLFDDDRIVGVVDYDKARWQPRVVELAEVLIYFASPRPGHLKHLVYPGTLQWEPFTRFLHYYARVVALEEREARALPDFIRCIWLSISLQRLLEKTEQICPTEALEAVHEVLALGNWARANAQRMTEVGLLLPTTHSRCRSNQPKEHR
jgi:Ser/Thr protein kinase RdoA (MazF antagonist)